MATATISTSNAAAQTKWLSEVFRGGLTNTMFAALTGNSANSVIRIDDTERRAGDTYVYKFDDQIAEDDWISGTTQLSGNTKKYTLSTDNLTLEILRVGRNIPGFTMSQLRTNTDLQQRVMSLFADGMATKVQGIIRDALLDTSSGRVQQRYLYGNVNSNWNATASTALGNVDATDDKLSLSGISIARRKARLESNGVGKMKPAKLTLQNGREVAGYILLAHEYAVRDLMNDSTARTYIKDRDSELFNVVNGADYVGQYDGVMIYKVQDENMLVSGVGASSIDVSHNLLLGANAAVLSFGVPEFPDDVPAGQVIKSQGGKAVLTHEFGDHFQNKETGMTFVAGARKLVDGSSGTNQDFGVVHYYTAGVAD